MGMGVTCTDNNTKIYKVDALAHSPKHYADFNKSVDTWLRNTGIKQCGLVTNCNI